MACATHAEKQGLANRNEKKNGKIDATQKQTSVRSFSPSFEPLHEVRM